MKTISTARPHVRRGGEGRRLRQERALARRINEGASWVSGVYPTIHHLRQDRELQRIDSNESLAKLADRKSETAAKEVANLRKKLDPNRALYGQEEE